MAYDCCWITNLSILARGNLFLGKGVKILYKIHIVCQGKSGSLDYSPEQTLTYSLRQNMDNILNIRNGTQDIITNDIEIIYQQLGAGHFEPQVVVTYEIATPKPHDSHHDKLISDLDEALARIGEYAIHAVVQEIVDYAVEATLGGVFAGGVGRHAIGKLSSTQEDGSTDDVSVLWDIVSAAIGGLIGYGLGSSIPKMKPIKTGSKDQFGKWTFWTFPQ